MSKSDAEVMASCVSAVDAEAINNARLALVRIGRRLCYLENNSAGRIFALAGSSEDDLFEVLNYACNFGRCSEACRALNEFDGKDNA